MIIPSYGMPPQNIHTFRHRPSKKEVDTVVSRYLPYPVKPTPHMYTEKPQLHVVPIDLCIKCNSCSKKENDTEDV